MQPFWPVQTVLFEEGFEDIGFAARGGYDGTGGALTASRIASASGRGLDAMTPRGSREKG